MTIISEYLSLHRNENSEFKRMYTLSLLNIVLEKKLEKVNLTEVPLIEKVEIINKVSKSDNYLRDLFLDLIKCLEIIENKKVFLEGSELTKVKVIDFGLKTYPSYVFNEFNNVIKIKTNSNIQVVDEVILLIDLIENKLPEIRKNTSARVLKL